MARSGHEYDDRTGVAYEYPCGRYENWIQTGERFVYQVPRVGYTGCGIIGEQRPSSEPSRIVCDVLSVDMFAEPVGLKDRSGHYFEADTAFWRDEVYWGQGVRPLSDERLRAILAVAEAAAPVTGRTPGGYPSSALTRATEDYSVAVAKRAMESRFGTVVAVMPRNNPGFDLRVGPEDDPVRYVEVKGTQAAAAVFFLSEGERQFSIRNGGRYTLFVVSGVDLKALSHAYDTTHDGPLQGESLAMSPTQWRGQIQPTTAT